MSYQVLARKWRPRTFQTMVGQEHVLRMLTNALDKNRLHHAYLFTGTRGVGKTTLGRILAKCLNCETGITSTPCNHCKPCTAIDNGRFLDLIEVDAASRTKVEDTRELLENVQYQPAQGRFKVYLIDEVHMLSSHSFNALLKTLEEPPPYVKFLLATTDPKRLPITILSRCLQFNLKRVPVTQITQHLQHICESEKIPFDAAALPLLAEAADGSMRDALSLLDQAIAFCGERLTLTETQQMLGSVEQDALFRLLHALAAKNGQQLLAEIAQLAEHAVDFNQAMDKLLSILHQVSITQTIGANPTQPDAVTQLAALLAVEDVQLYYQIALIGRRDLSLAANMQQGFEMTMLRMLAFSPIAAEFPSARQTASFSEPAGSHRSITGTSASAPQPAGTAEPKTVTSQSTSASSTPGLRMTSKTNATQQPPATTDRLDLAQSSLAGKRHSTRSSAATDALDLVQPLTTGKLNSTQLSAATDRFDPTLPPTTGKLHSTHSSAATDKRDPTQSPTTGKLHSTHSSAATDKRDPTQSPTTGKLHPTHLSAATDKRDPMQPPTTGKLNLTLTQPSAITDKLDMPQATMTAHSASTQPTVPDKFSPSAPINRAPSAASTQPLPTAASEITNQSWPSICGKLHLTGMALELASNCTLLAFTDTRITLALSTQHQAMCNQKRTEQIEQALQRYFNKPLTLDIQLTTEEVITPAKQHQEHQALRQKSAADAIKNDSHVHKIMDIFNATLDEGSIKAV